LEPWQNLTKDASFIVDGWLGASHIAVNGKQAAILKGILKPDGSSNLNPDGSINLPPI
jgi:hypothetical protein